eukprot:9503290-Pyramimonas_sp.AAC.1
MSAHHTLRGPMDSSTEVPHGSVHIMSVAPRGAPPKSRVAGSTCASPPHLGTPLARFVAP